MKRSPEVDDLQQFLNERRDQPQGPWPRVNRLEDDESSGRLHVCIYGNTVLDLPIELDCTYAEFVSAMASGNEKYRAEWQLGLPRVGGLVGNLAPLAHDLGFRVSIASVIGVPADRAIREFLECGKYDTRLVRALPGPTSASLELRFRDGRHFLVPRRGVDQAIEREIPVPARSRYAAMLANAGPTVGRLRMLRRLAELERASGMTLGIIGRGDWTRDELTVLSGTRAWLFVNRQEAHDVAQAVADGAPPATPADVARVIKAHLGRGPRLLISLDREGGLLLNGKPDPVPLPTEPVDEGNTTGAGDTLALFATLASSTGAADDEAASLAVMAATKRIAGAMLPSLAS